MSPQVKTERKKLTDQLRRVSASLRCSGVSLVAQMVKKLPVRQKTRVQSPGWEDPLEKGMGTHSSILAWRVPWTEEYSRLKVQGVTKHRVQLTDFHFTSLHFWEIAKDWGAWHSAAHGLTKSGHDLATEQQPAFAFPGWTFSILLRESSWEMGSVLSLSSSLARNSFWPFAMWAPGKNLCLLPRRACSFTSFVQPCSHITVA